MSKRHKKVCTTINYIELFVILASVATGCITIYASASLLDIPVVITNYAIGLIICTKTSGIKKC